VASGSFFGVHAESGDEGEGGAAFEFGLAIGPGGDFVEGVGCAAKDVQAGLIADVPSIEVGNPRIHEIGGKLLGVSGEDGEQLGFVNGLGPKARMPARGRGGVVWRDRGERPWIGREVRCGGESQNGFGQRRFGGWRSGGGGR